MSDRPVFDYTCSKCGATETYSLVPGQRQSGESGTSRAPNEIDFTCARCGTNETYSLVPAARAA
jgi:predicted nucleic-acid-binding Zn-ribbon protein